MQDLVERLKQVKAAIRGCESLSVASSDGFVLATTHEELRQGEFLAAVTSVMLASCSRGLAPFKAGRCRALDFRGDRQVMVTQLQDLGAYLVCVLHPGAQPVNIDEPALRAVTTTLPGVLHGEEAQKVLRYFLQRDKDCLIPLRRGFLVGRADHCDLYVPSKQIDEEHLRFEVLGDQLLVRDLDTRHGSKINRKAFTGTAELQPGDRITLPRSGGFNVVAMNADGTIVRKGKGKGKAAASQA